MLSCASGFLHGKTRGLRADGSLGLRHQVPAQGHHCASLRGARVFVEDDVRGIRVRASRGRMGARSCASSGRIPAEGVALEAGQLAQGRVGSSASSTQVPRGDLEALGSSLLESELLRRVVRRRSARSGQTLCGGATRRRRFLKARIQSITAQTESETPRTVWRWLPSRLPVSTPNPRRAPPTCWAQSG